MGEGVGSSTYFIVYPHQSYKSDKALPHIKRPCQIITLSFTLGGKSRFRHQEAKLREQTKTKEQVVIEPNELKSEIEDLEKESKLARERLKKCEMQKTILDAIPDPAWLKDIKGRFLAVNVPWLEFMDRQDEDFIGKTVFDLFPQKTAQKLHEAHLETITTGKQLRMEKSLQNKEGNVKWFETIKGPLCIDNGMIVGTLGIVRDISGRKQAENSLIRLNRALRTLTKCNEVLVRAENETDLLNNICRIIVEEGAYRLAWVGYAENDKEKTVRPVALAGHEQGFLETADVVWADTERGRGPTGTAIREGSPCLIKDIRNDPRFTPWHGGALERGYLSALSIPLISGAEVFGALAVYASELSAFDEEEINLLVQLAGDLAYGIMSLRTTVKHRSIAEKLAKNEHMLAKAQAIAHLGSWEYDLEKDKEYRSAEFYRILGLPAQETGPADDSVLNYIHPDDRENVLKRITETLEEGKPYDIEYRIIRPDGVERVVHAQGQTLEDKNGKTTKFIGTVLDITDRKRAVEALRASKARFRALVETTTDWIWETDKNFTYSYSSPKIRDLLGYEPKEVIGKTPFDLMHPEESQRLAERFSAIKDAREPFSGLENVNMHKDGNLVTIETSGMPVFDADGRFCGYRGIDRDVTARKKLEQQYLQAQKMEAVGQLAGGIAHDFNNILTAIIGFQYLLSERLEDEKSRHYAEQVTTLAGKAAVLTQDLLTFSRSGKQTICPKPVDLNDAIEKTGKLLKRLIGEDIEFRSILHDGELPVMAVASQIEQVLMNLATNARDAMPDGGSLTMRTDIVDINNDFVQANGYGEIGKHALVSVSDSGTGMDEQTRRRIFEPFFTTKEVGKGTGLGLATAYGIIKRHNGYINVYSEPGEGTIFRIYLPLAETGGGEEEVAKEHIFPARGTETVLLAEDEPEVQESIKSLLEANGYRVIEAVDGDDALDKYVAHEADIDVLISDVIMPKRNGKEVYDIISKARPGIKTLFISGYTADLVEGKKIPDTCHLVTKPFSPHVFLKTLRGLLDGADRKRDE